MQFIPEDPIHPADILKEDFMAEYGLSTVRMAQDIGVAHERLEDIIHGRSAIDADLALRLSRYFGTSPEFWMNMQFSYDLAIAARDGVGIDAIRPVDAA